MDELDIKNKVSDINNTLTDDLLKNLSDEQLNELENLVKEINTKLESLKQ